MMDKLPLCSLSSRGHRFMRPLIMQRSHWFLFSKISWNTIASKIKNTCSYRPICLVWFGKSTVEQETISKSCEPFTFAHLSLSRTEVSSVRGIPVCMHRHSFISGGSVFDACVGIRTGFFTKMQCLCSIRALIDVIYLHWLILLIYVEEWIDRFVRPEIHAFAWVNKKQTDGMVLRHGFYWFFQTDVMLINVLTEWIKSQLHCFTQSYGNDVDRPPQATLFPHLT